MGRPRLLSLDSKPVSPRWLLVTLSSLPHTFLSIPFEGLLPDNLPTRDNVRLNE